MPLRFEMGPHWAALTERGWEHRLSPPVGCLPPQAQKPPPPRQPHSPLEHSLPRPSTPFPSPLWTGLLLALLPVRTSVLVQAQDFSAAGPCSVPAACLLSRQHVLSPRRRLPGALSSFFRDVVPVSLPQAQLGHLFAGSAFFQGISAVCNCVFSRLSALLPSLFLPC